MATNNIWKVIYAYKANNKTGYDGQQNDTVIAADSKEDTIRAVLVSNGRSRPGATIEIIHVSQAGVPGGGANVLS